MTRINLVPPAELADQHLFAEFREIKMVPKALRRSIKAFGANTVLSRIPSHFTLNKGHVSFFYDKGLYLTRRYQDIRDELDARGIQYNKDSRIDPDGVWQNPIWMNDYEPTPEALVLVRSRIADRISQKPGWYRYTSCITPPRHV
jgi:deoxyribonuclease (pyrimidine dimer)